MTLQLSDYIFHDIRKEYLDSMSGKGGRPDSSVIYQYFYEQEIAPYVDLEGSPEGKYRYDPKKVTAREAGSFRYRIMEAYNALYQARDRGKMTKEIDMVKTLLQSVEKIPKRYTEGCRIYESEGGIVDDMSCYQPLIFHGLDYAPSDIREFRMHPTFYAYTKKLTELVKCLEQKSTHTSLSQRLSKVTLAEYKRISDRLLRTSLHATIYDFLYNMGYSPAQAPGYVSNSPRGTISKKPQVRKHDRAMELINRYCQEYPDRLEEYTRMSEEANDVKTAVRMDERIEKKEHSYRQTNKMYENPTSSEKEIYNRLYEELCESGNRDLYVPLATDPSGVGIYIIGQNYYRNQLNTKVIPDKYKKICCSMGVIVQRTREEGADGEAIMESEIITEFDPYTYSSYDNLRNPYQIAVGDARRLLQEYNSNNSLETNAAIQEIIQDSDRLQGYFQLKSRKNRRDEIMRQEQQELQDRKQEWKERSGTQGVR